MTPNPLPHAQALPAPVFHPPAMQDGWRWLKEGWRIFWSKPLAMLSVVLLSIIIPMALTLLPVVGETLGLLLIPGLTAGVMYCAFLVSQGMHPFPHMVASPFFWGPERKNLPRLRATLIIGVVHALCTLAAMLVAQTYAGEQWQALEKLQALQRSNSPTAVQDMQQLVLASPRLITALALNTIFITGIFLITTRAAMLSFCFGIHPGKAFFFSIHSLWRSVTALVVFGLGLLLAAFLLANLMLLHPIAFSIGNMLFMGVVFCSLWAMFGQAFPPLVRSANATPPDPSNPPPSTPPDTPPHDSV